MYICKKCGNRSTFIESNIVNTNLTLNPETGEIVSSYDEYVDCTTVTCTVCGLSSEDDTVIENILTK